MKKNAKQIVIAEGHGAMIRSTGYESLSYSDLDLSHAPRLRQLEDRDVPPFIPHS